MKTNLISFTAILVLAGVLFSSSANAQTTGTVDFKLILNPIQSIVVNPSEKTSTIEYKSIADYDGGVSKTAAKQLNVFSTHGFQVQASATAFTSDGPTTSKPELSSINVLVTKNEGIASHASGIQLSTTPTTLYSSTEATKTSSGFDLDVKYTGAKDFIYAERNLFSPISSGANSPTTTTHTTTVTYSIVAL